MRTFSALFAAATLAATNANATPDDLRSVAGMQSHNRVLLVFAPSLRDAKLTAQREVMAKAALDAATRDLLLVQVADEQVIGAHDTAEGLRRRFHAPVPAYRAMLIGKDGNVALTTEDVLPAARIVSLIDAMPMRREEMRRARAGEGKSEQ